MAGTGQAEAISALEEQIRNKSFKLRPVLKTEEELEAERYQFFELPRKNCIQIMPELSRLNGKGSTTQHRVHVLKRLLQRARYADASEHLKHVTDYDVSDKIVPHGEVSKALYNDIVLQRDFDLYGRQMQTGIKHPFRKYLEMKALAGKLGIEFTQHLDTTKDEKVVKDMVEEDADAKMNEARLQTDKWKIGQTELHHAPVGLSKNPVQPFKSLDNEKFYSYDGDWKDGKMHGLGTYLFRDGYTYRGEWEKNKQHGEGTAYYSGDRFYTGEWKNGRYDGKGNFTYTTGATYRGQFEFGRRGGHGRIEYPSGLVYEGEFHDGKPHGRGFMKSKLTGWAYEGGFERGNIAGSGTLIYPAPEKRRDILYFAPLKNDHETRTLPDVVKEHYANKEDAQLQADRNKNEIFGPLRGAALQTYVSNIRSTLYNARVKEKKDRYNEALRKVKEQKQKLYEARLKALAGEEA